MPTNKEDHWSSNAYQKSASFVPQLATKVVSWLDVQPDDVILDIGCGDGVLTHQLSSSLTGTGHIHATDSSPSMIATAESQYSSPNITYTLLDATNLISHSVFQNQAFSKIFSNAALHWILRPVATRKTVFESFNTALRPGGVLCFEMGGMGNVAEMHAALLYAISRRVGIAKAREVDPWFFPDERWIRQTLEETGFVVEKCELEYRPTQATEGKEGAGLEGWARLMGKQFLDVLDEGREREAAVQEVCEVLKTVCGSEAGGVFLGYVRLRVLARKV